MTTVKLLALWHGWCDACHVERPLALTEHGEHGLRAWLKGIGSEDHRLVLACEVCGHGQDVPLHEQDDPEPTPAPEPAPEPAPGPAPEPAAEAAVPPTVTAATLIALPRQAPPLRTAELPAPHGAAPAPGPAQVLDLVSQGFDLLSPGSS